MNTFKYIIIFLWAGIGIQIQAEAQDLYSLPMLPYAYNALEPYIDAQTMEIHHSKHHQAYVTNLNKVIAGTEAASQPLEGLLSSISRYPVAVRNNAGGHYNHSLFWTILTPNRNTQPSKRLLDAIVKQYGSVDSLKTLLNLAALKQFGSGWAWLSVDSNKKLVVSSTANQDNPLMDVVDIKGIPLLGIDVWEHAYYLKYQNRRGDYLSAIWNVLNWDEVSRRYEAIVPAGMFDDWQEIKDFHGVMSQTFHPSEEGNLEPIKARSGEMVAKAEALANGKIPPAFDTPRVNEAVEKLVADSKKLDKLVQKKAKDEEITKALSDLHDTFHTIVESCSTMEEDH